MGNRFRETVNGIEEAINKHVKEHKEENSIVTGWIVIASVAESNHMERDGYIIQTSPSMPHHVQVGLMSMALDDKRNLGIIATLQSMIGGDD